MSCVSKVKPIRAVKLHCAFDRHEVFWIPRNLTNKYCLPCLLRRVQFLDAEIFQAWKYRTLQEPCSGKFSRSGKNRCADNSCGSCLTCVRSIAMRDDPAKRRGLTYNDSWEVTGLFRVVVWNPRRRQWVEGRNLRQERGVEAEIKNQLDKALKTSTFDEECVYLVYLTKCVASWPRVH